MLRSVGRSESSKLPVSTTARSGSMEGPFGSTYSVNTSSATMPSVSRLNYEAIDGRLGPLPPPPVPSTNGRPSPPSSRCVTQAPAVNSQVNGQRRSPGLSHHPALGISSLFSYSSSPSPSNHSAIQINSSNSNNNNNNNNNSNSNININTNAMMTHHNNRLSPGRITHLQLLNAGEKKGEVINAFTSSSSSSASSSGSNPPSVPTTPESQSNERLSTLTRSQPDLSKLEELEYYYNININSSVTNGSTVNLDGPSGNLNGGNLNNNTTSSNNNHNLTTANGTNNSSGGNYSVYVNRGNGHPSFGYTACPNKFESHKFDTIDSDSLYSNAAVINQHSISNNYSMNKNFNTSINSSNNNNYHNTYNPPLPYGGRNSTSNLPPPSPSKNQANRGNNNSEYQNQAELLRMENRALKGELDTLKSKLTKYEKVEDEIQRVLQVHEDFVNSTVKKEQLEKRLRDALHFEVKKLQEENRQLKEQNEVVLTAIAVKSSSSTSNLNNIDSTGTVSPCYSADSGGTGNYSSANREKGRELSIAQLLVDENKQLRVVKENQECELQAQRLTLVTQRAHIKVLEEALSAAQSSHQAELYKLQATKQETI